MKSRHTALYFPVKFMSKQANQFSVNPGSIGAATRICKRWRCVSLNCTVEPRCHELEMILICFERSLDAQHGFTIMSWNTCCIHRFMKPISTYIFLLYSCLAWRYDVNSIKLKNMQPTCKHANIINEVMGNHAVTLQFSLQVSASPLLPAHAQKKSLHLTWWC